jgi:polar amino acid transport system substrate-binding protein
MYRTFYSFVLALALALSSGPGALAQTRDTIRVTNGEWPPFLSEHAPHYGFASHIITEAFALVGVEVEYGFFPWKRSYKLAMEGKWDGSAIWWENEERRTLFYFTDSVSSTREAFFHLKAKAFDWTRYEDLRELRIGGTNPYDYGKAFNDAESVGIINVERAPNDETSLKKLLKGRLDVFPGTVMVTYEQIRKTFSDEEAALLTHHPKPIAERPVYLIFSKKLPGNEHMRDRFNEGLRMLKENGRWDQIIADALAGEYDAKLK